MKLGSLKHGLLTAGVALISQGCAQDTLTSKPPEGVGASAGHVSMGGTAGGLSSSGGASGASTAGGATSPIGAGGTLITTGGAAGISSMGGASAGAVTNGGMSSSVFPAGQGMNMPWIEFQAEDPAHATTNATVLSPSRKKWDKTQIQAEAIGRQAVKLGKLGDYVEFTTTQPANSLVVRFSIPDSPDGKGLDATLGLYINGARVKSMKLTSHYSWSYNGEYIPGAATDTDGAASLNDPSKPFPHTFFDEYNTGPGDLAADMPLIGELPAGTKVRLQRDAQDTAEFYIIDLVDFEEVPAALPMPAGFTSITDASLGVNIKPNDGIDHADDLEKVLLGGVKKLYFPPGEYIVRKYVSYSANAALDNNGTEIAGAGMWYTRIKGKQAIFFCDTAGGQCNMHDFAIFGDATARDEPVNGPQKAVGGPQGNGTQLYNLWIEHEVAGLWIGGDPPYQDQQTQNIHIHDVRIRDTFADGINLDNGTSNSLVENCHMRNTGDDSATVWSVKWTKWAAENPGAVKPNALNAPDQGIAHGNTFDHISVQMPWRADCFAAYGGYNNTWKNSTCEDVLTYPGLFVDNEFGIYPYGSESSPAPQAPLMTTFDNITLLRAGGEMFYEPNSTSCGGGACPGPAWDHGALKLYMREGDVNDVLIQNISIIDPTYAGIELRGMTTAVAQKYGIDTPSSTYPQVFADADKAKFSNVTLKNITVTGAGTYGISVMDLDTGNRGTVIFDNVNVSNAGMSPLSMNSAPAALITKMGTTNQGW
jgi:hypothetical protein